MRRLSLRPLYEHIRSLHSGDKAVVAVLACVLCALLLAGLYSFERQFLVEIPSRGGSLLEGVAGAPRFVNPVLALSDADRDLTALTYAGLMGYDKEGALVPVLAESYAVSEDGLVYTFALREHARYSDGTPVTAEDVVFTVEKTQDPDIKSPRLSDFANIRVEAIDARTVRFTLPAPYAPFLVDATLGILPAHVWRDVKNTEFPFAPEMIEPVGAGPFKVSRVVRDKSGAVERYELKAFDGYALSRPYLDGITFVYFKDEETLQRALMRGSVESAHGVPSESFVRAPYSRIFGAFFNQGKNGALARPSVRKALSVAIDRETLVRDALAGFAFPAYGPVPPGITHSHYEEPADRIAEAKSILERDGWEYNEEAGVWEREGASLSFSLTTSNVPELKAVAERLRLDWQTLGVPVALDVYDPNALVRDAIRPRNYEALLFGMVVGRDKDFYAFWDSSQRNDPGLNVSLYTNLAVDELLDELRLETDEAQLEASLHELNDLIASDYPAVFTHAPEFVYSIPEDLKGIALESITAPSDRFLSAAFWYRHTEHVWPVFAR